MATVGEPARKSARLTGTFLGWRGFISYGLLRPFPAKTPGAGTGGCSPLQGVPMFRRILCAVAIMAIGLSFAAADEIKGTITSVSKTQVTVRTGQKKAKKTETF